MSKETVKAASVKKETAKTSKAKTSKVVEPEVEYAEVEEVFETSHQTQEKGLVITTQNIIDQEVSKYDITKEALALKVASYKGNEIAVIENKEQYDIVYKDYQDARNTRLAVSGKSKGIIADIKKIEQGIKNYESDLISVISPVEAELLAKRKVWEDAETERKEKEKKQKEAEAQKRMDDLFEAGIVFDGSFYSCGSISVNKVDIDKLTDLQYSKLLENVAAQKAAIDQALEDQRLKQEEEARIAAEQAEKERLAAIEQAKQNEEMKRNLLQMRTMLIEAQGATLQDGNYVYEGISVATAESVANASDMDFLEINKAIQENIRLVKIQKEQAKKDLEKLNILNQKIDFLLSLGYQKSIEKNELFYKLNYGDQEEINISIDYLTKIEKEFTQDEKNAFSLEVENTIKKADEHLRNALKEKEEAEKKEAAEKEKLRVSKLGDSEKWSEYIAKLKEVEAPEFETEEYQKALKVFLSTLK